MCELFGVSAGKKIRANELLNIFFSHSKEHPNGWGIALFDDGSVFIDKAPEKAIDSVYLKNKLERDIETSKCIAHIRKATVGDVKFTNTHPFSYRDASGRRWILAHNGTIFDSEVLAPYQYVQEGSSDSERILLCIIDEMNKLYFEKGALLSADDRIRIVEEIIYRIVAGNKVNLLIYDGEFFYVHKNEVGTLYQKKIEGGVVFSTQVLDKDNWVESPKNRLQVYKDGDLVYSGKEHHHTYIYDEEDMKLIYLAYSEL